MNTCIQTLNDWGESFLSFAWPMLWQSSLLMAVVFVFDVLFARRIRAAVRYALWLCVLVKLLLPPTLALPTGAVWWMWPAKPALAPVINHEVVTFDGPATPLPAVSVPQTVPYVPPPPELSGAGWVMLGNVVVGSALLLWLVFRWWRVAAKVRRAAGLHDKSLVPRLEGSRPHPQERENHSQVVCNDERKSQFEISTRDGRIIEYLREVCERAGLRRCPQLKLVEDVQSPAVYGLFRPVILLPRALVEKLSARQLRAVLLHEAIHLRRGDVWMNCAQTLLQIAYWWHPLFWLANARIRRLREEAVDDAVMLTLRADADAYAPTLLEVAKFSFRRPLAALALVGILESRSALRRRIERLVDFRAPRRAGLTILSLCGIFAFSTVALPMGQGPAPENAPSQADPVIKAGYVNAPASTQYVGATNNFTMGRKAIYQKMKLMTIGQVKMQSLPLSEVIRWLREKSQISDPDKTGINFNFDPGSGGGSQIDPSTGLPVNAPTNSALADPTQINITLALTNLSLLDLLSAIVANSDHPIRYSIEDYGVVFSAKATNSPQYEMRIFKIEPNVYPYLQKIIKLPPSMPPAFATATSGFLYVESSNSLAMSGVFKQYFLRLGLNLDPPKQVYFNSRSSDLFVYATPQDLDVIEKAIHLLNEMPLPNQPVSIATYVHDGISEQTKLALNQALVEERQAAHMDLTAQATLNSSQTPYSTVIDPATGLPASDAPTPIINPMTGLPESLAPANSVNGINVFTNTKVIGGLIDKNGLEMRVFHVGTKAFLASLQNAAASLQIHNSGSDVPSTLKQFFAKLGVDLSPPKNIWFSRGNGDIFVQATPQDLDSIERALHILLKTPPMLHIKAWFFEMPSSGRLTEATKDATHAYHGYGVLTASQAEKTLQMLRHQKDVLELAEPEVTTISGRQTEMRSTGFLPIVTNFLLDADSDQAVPQAMQLETGPVFNVFPYLLADGYTIAMRADASYAEFLGYADSEDLNSYATNSAGKKVKLPVVLPVIQQHEESTSANLWDGQTLVLMPKLSMVATGGPADTYQDRITRQAQKEEDKVLVVFVTATLIDPAGNRVHSESEMPFAQNGIPNQTPPRP